jgi:hypothetical protein
MKLILCKDFPDAFITMLDYKCELNLTELLKHLHECKYCTRNIESAIKNSKLNIMNKTILLNFFTQIREN